MNIKSLNHLLGNMDLFLLDQLLKGRVPKDEPVLDAGCGEGRNLSYFIQQEYQIHAVDKNPSAIRMINYLSRSLAQSNKLSGRFQVAELETLPYNDQYFGCIFSIASLHFARNQDHFLEMFHELSRILATGGTLLITTAAMADRTVTAETASGTYFEQSGAMRFVLSTDLIAEYLLATFELLDPVKYLLEDSGLEMCWLALQKKA